MDEFERLLTENRTAVERWVKARIGSPADAEDILQDACLAAFQGFSGLKNKASFLPWLLGIARRKCADWYRAQARNRVIPTETLPDVAQCPPDDFGVAETLGALPARDQMMLRLFYQDMLSQKQISRQLRIPEGTVKSRMSAARSHFRAAYPNQHQGGILMEKKKETALPKLLPEYTIVWKDAPAFPVVCEELAGWFIVPKIGESIVWGMYDLPSRKLDVSYENTVIGPARVHGLEGVSIRSSVLPPQSDIAPDDPINEAVAASTGGQEEWMFIAQEKDGYTRFLSAEHVDRGVRTLTTFLDGEAFMNNWGFGEDNCGMPTHLAVRGIIRRSGRTVTAPADKAAMDIVGRCEVTLGGVRHDTVCLMDIGLYDQEIVSEQYLNRDGRTVLWRRFNRDDWAMDRYGKTWSELLPENEQLTINGQRYVHWYDCLVLH